MTAYDQEQFDPPAPVTRIIVRNATRGLAVQDVPMLLDTGADVTLLPRSVIEPLGLSGAVKDEYELVAFDGRRVFAPVVHVELAFCKRKFRGQFLIIDQSWGVLGRNVLNAVSLLFDGPKLAWEEFGSGSSVNPQ
jgi:hypothetical protein